MVIGSPVLLGLRKKNRRSYCLAFKKQAVASALSIGNFREAARIYGVSNRLVSKWNQSFEKSLAEARDLDLRTQIFGVHCMRLHKHISSSKKQRFRGGGRKNDLPIETQLILKNYVDELRDQDLSVSLRGLTSEFHRVVAPVSEVCLSTVAVRSRLYRLLKSWNCSYRRKTHKAQGTRHCVCVITDFLDYVKHKIQLLGINDEDVYNCDQTNCYYSMESSYTWGPKGSKTVAIKGADTASRCTIMLGANLTGTNKLPPYIIFKGVQSSITGRIARDILVKRNLPDECEYGVQEKAWMNEIEMLRWIEVVWKPFTAAREGKQTYLILDECRTHMTAKIASAFIECDTEVDFIPGGYTAKLQPMDVGINKPFKNYVRRMFDEWLIANLNNNKPKRNDVSQWILDAWKLVTVDTIRNSWRKVGIEQRTVNAAVVADDNIDDDGDDLVLGAVPVQLDEDEDEPEQADYWVTVNS
jgi:transposase-like protein